MPHIDILMSHGILCFIYGYIWTLLYFTTFGQNMTTWCEDKNTWAAWECHFVLKSPILSGYSCGINRYGK